MKLLFASYWTGYCARLIDNVAVSTVQHSIKGLLVTEKGSVLGVLEKMLFGGGVRYYTEPCYDS